MKNVNYFFTIIICITIILACQKDIGFGKIDTSYNAQIFVEGILYPEENPKIYVSNSLPFFHEKVTPQEIFVRGARVILSSGDVSETLVPDSTFDKFRCRWNPFYTGNIPIVYGKTYQLSVDAGGQLLTGETKIDQPKVNIKNVTYTPEFFDVYGGHDGVVIQLQDAPGRGNHYRFQMDRMIDNTRFHAHVLEVVVNTCTSDGEQFPITDLGRTIFSDGGNDGGILEMNIEVSFEYLEGDSTTIYMQSLDKESAAFYDELDDQLQAIFNPFVEPVFLHSTMDGGFGVFGSAVRSDPVPFIYPQDNP